MIRLKPYSFPTQAHEQSAQEIVKRFGSLPQVQAVLLVNSCARGVATPESDLDIAILIDPATSPENWGLLENTWREFYATQPIFQTLKQLGRFSGVHLDFFSGQWAPETWDDGGGPDYFEVEIGNRVAYAAPLYETGGHFQALRAAWLPYYGQPLQQQRLAMVQEACRMNVARLGFYVDRGLYFQAFDRLYHAFQEFLQAVFIARAVYPLAYNKWIREQVVEWLELPQLYAQLPALLQVSQLEGQELNHKGQQLLELLDTWTH